ncbi:MAG: VCBS repeat-containing protein [Haliscomenobacter sp.]|nr:VCBS repeat-containing protein [Haliscomenobacter sp.]
MKPVLLLPTLLAAQLSYAQTFTEIPLAPPFAGVFDGAVAFSDVDLDGDEDALITGTGSAWAPVAKLYLNDGRGRFSEKPNSPFEEVFVSALAFADVDGDGDEDVLISGQGSGNSIPRLYLNNGRGEFAQYMGLPFEPVTHSSLAFADIDGDRDLDLLLTGQSVTLNAPVAKLYANDGRGRFHEISGAPFTGVLSASIAFADVDGNGSPDVLIAGASKAGILSSKLYLNNGKGRFAEQTNTPFTGVYSGSAAFADADGDGDQDLLLTGNRNGASESAAPLSKLYLNDGRGVFTEKTEVPFINVCYSAIAFADVDSDGDEDLLLTGNSQSLSALPSCTSTTGRPVSAKGPELPSTEGTIVRSLFPTWTSTAIWTCSLPGWVLRGLWPSYTPTPVRAGLPSGRARLLSACISAPPRLPISTATATRICF